MTDIRKTSEQHKEMRRMIEAAIQKDLPILITMKNGSHAEILLRNLDRDMLYGLVLTLLDDKVKEDPNAGVQFVVQLMSLIPGADVTHIANPDSKGDH